MKKSLSFLVFVLFFSGSCINGKNKEGVWHNELINPALRASVSAMNKEVYSCMSINDYAHLSQLFSDSLKNNINADFEAKLCPGSKKY
jgi:hypothetical protein